MSSILFGSTINMYYPNELPAGRITISKSILSNFSKIQIEEFISKCNEGVNFFEYEGYYLCPIDNIGEDTIWLIKSIRKGCSVYSLMLTHEL